MCKVCRVSDIPLVRWDMATLKDDARRGRQDVSNVAQLLEEILIL